MKRPLFWIGLSVFCATVVVFSFSLPPQRMGGIFLGAGAVLLAVGQRGKHTPFAALLTLAAAAGCFWYSLYWQGSIAPFLGYSGQMATVSGTVREVIPGERGYWFVVEGTAPQVANGKNGVWQLFLRGDEPPAAGSLVRCEGAVYSLSPQEKYDLYRLADGVNLRGYVTGTPLVTGESQTLKARMDRQRQQGMEQLAHLYPTKEAGLLSALLFGHREQLDANLYQALQAAGLAHTVAISGLHLAVVMGIAFFLLDRLGMSGWLTRAVGIPLAWAIAALGGMGPAVVRAAILVTIPAVGYLLARRHDPLNSLGLAALLLFVHNPLVLLSLSFQCTFLACLGLFTVGPTLHTWWAGRRNAHSHSRWDSWLTSTGHGVLTALAAQSLLFPLLWYQFGYLSLGFLPAGVLALPVLPLILGIGYLTAFCPLPIGRWLAGAVRPLIGYYCAVAEWVASLGLLLYGNWWMFLLWVGAAMAFALWLWRCRPARLVRTAGALLLTLALLAATIPTLWLENHTLRVIWFPQEESVLLVRQGRGAVLGLGKYCTETRAALERFGVQQLDYLLLADSAFTQSTEAAQLIRDYRPAYLTVPDTLLATSYLEYLPQGQRVPLQPMGIELLGGVQVQLDPSVGMRIEFGGTAILKYLDLYDIMEESNPWGVLLPAVGPAQFGTLPTRSRVQRTPEGAWMLLLPTE